jgi:tetratricopeptide (TPR) repeat protein
MKRPGNQSVAGMAAGAFLVALAVRLIHVLQIRDAPFFSVLLGDARGYDEWAQRIAGGDWIGTEVFYQAPLYPYFLGVLYTVAGRDLLLLRLAQAFIGATSSVLLALGAARLFGRSAGVCAGLAMALYAPAIFFDGLVQKSVLDIFFICLSIWLMSRIITTPPTRVQWVCLGLAMGALSLTRENALVLVVVVAAWAIAGPHATTETRGHASDAPAHASGRSKQRTASRSTHEQTSRAQMLPAALAFAAGLAVVLVPVAVRNYVVGGGFYLTTSQFGPNFYIGNNAGADGTYASLRPGRGAPEYERLDATQLAEHAVGRRLTPGEVSGYWTGRALDFITAQPGAWLALMGRKVALLVNADEMLDTESQESYADWSMPLRWLSWIGHFGVLVPLAALGMWTAWPDRRRLWVFYAMTAAYGASVVMFYVFARYRAPMIPLLMLFAASGVARIGRRSETPGRDPVEVEDWPAPAAMRSRAQADARRGIGVSSRRGWGPVASAKKLTLAGVGIALVLIAVLANWPILSTSVMRAITENNLATALQEEGRVDDALVHYRRAIGIEPSYAPAYNNMGTALRRAGRLDEAVASYRRAIEMLADYPDAHYNLANALIDQGKPAEATTHFRIALRAIPGEARVHNNLGIALAEEGKLDEAIAAFERALEADPQSAITHRNLGDALSSRGRGDEAIAHLRRAVEIAPEDAGFHYDLGSIYLQASRFREATGEFRQAIALKPDHVGAHNNLGIALASDGHVNEALSHFRRALEIQPGFEDAQRNLTMTLEAIKKN